MSHYIIRNYHSGFEEGQARIGIQVARQWIWPYAYDRDDLLKISAGPDFDPETRHYCFLGEEMVGYMFSLVTDTADGGRTAALEFPRMLPGHEQAAALLMKCAFETLREKGVSQVTGRVTSMCPGDIELAEKTGFAIREWGYKVYYSYAMDRGRLNIPADAAVEIDPGRDLEECARIAARWYNRPAEWCLSLLREWHEWGVITHSAVRESGRIVAACMAAPNVLRPSTAAIYYIYTPDEPRLEPLLARVVSRCVDQGVHNVIADLINEHRAYEPVYQKLGFRKVAEWAQCEKILQ